MRGGGGERYNYKSFMITMNVEGSLGSLLLRFVSRGSLNIQSVPLLRSHGFRFLASSMPAIPGALYMCTCKREKRENTYNRGRKGGRFKHRNCRTGAVLCYLYLTTN